MSEDWNPYVEEIATGVYVHVQPDGGWYLNNSGFVVGRDGVVLIDLAATESRSRALIERVGDVAHGAPLRLAVNTHHHGDHTYGNFVLPRDVNLLATTSTRNLIAELNVSTAVPDKYLVNPDTGRPPMWGDLELRLPDLTIETPTTYRDGDLELQFIPVDTVAHTAGDLLVWVPEHRVLFVGDLLFVGAMPLAAEGSIAGWIQALDQVRQLGPERIVAGHGPPTDPGYLDQTESYLRWIQETAADGLRLGKAPLEMARAVGSGVFGDLREGERVVANLHRAYSEARGEPPGTILPLEDLVRDMVELNGGPLKCVS